jgi:hypothetical protein
MADQVFRQGKSCRSLHTTSTAVVGQAFHGWQARTTAAEGLAVLDPRWSGAMEFFCACGGIVGFRRTKQTPAAIWRN